MNLTFAGNFNYYFNYCLEVWTLFINNTEKEVFGYSKKFKILKKLVMISSYFLCR